jgi:hypothetical protein
VSDPRPSAAEIVTICVDVVEVVVGAADKGAAIDAARGLLSGLDAETARRVAAAVAVECLLSMRARPSPERVREWAEKVRLELMWMSS